MAPSLPTDRKRARNNASRSLVQPVLPVLPSRSPKPEPLEPTLALRDEPTASIEEPSSPDSQQSRLRVPLHLLSFHCEESESDEEVHELPQSTSPPELQSVEIQDELLRRESRSSDSASTLAQIVFSTPDSVATPDSEVESSGPPEASDLTSYLRREYERRNEEGDTYLVITHLGVPSKPHGGHAFILCRSRKLRGLIEQSRIHGVPPWIPIAVASPVPLHPLAIETVIHYLYTDSTPIAESSHQDLLSSCAVIGVLLQLWDFVDATTRFLGNTWNEEATQLGARLRKLAATEDNVDLGEQMQKIRAQASRRAALLEDAEVYPLLAVLGKWLCERGDGAAERPTSGS